MTTPQPNELHVEMHNPRPEAVAESVPRVLREMGFLHPSQRDFPWPAVLASLACALSAFALLLSAVAVAK